jgi:hypothetical protein
MTPMTPTDHRTVEPKAEKTGRRAVPHSPHLPQELPPGHLPETEPVLPPVRTMIPNNRKNPEGLPKHFERHCRF